MAELCVCRFFVILAHLAVVLVLAQNPIEEKTTFEAAFQGKCSIDCIYRLFDGGIDIFYTSIDLVRTRSLYILTIRSCFFVDLYLTVVVIVVIVVVDS